MGKPKINSDLIPGHIDTIILRVLLDGGNYGYEIIKVISQISNGDHKLKEAVSNLIAKVEVQNG